MVLLDTGELSWLEVIMHIISKAGWGGDDEVFFNPESKSIPRGCLAYLTRPLIGENWVIPLAKVRVMVFLYKYRFRSLAFKLF